MLVKEPSNFRLIAGISDLITKEEFSFGQITPFLGSRAFNSLKLWMVMKHIGVKNIGRLIEHRHGMALYLESLINKERDFHMMNRVNINNVVYIYAPDKLRNMLLESSRERATELLNKLNENIHKRIFAEGDYYIHTFKLNDFMNVLGLGPESVWQVQRVSFGNPLTTKRVIKDFISYLKKISAEEYSTIMATRESN